MIILVCRHDTVAYLEWQKLVCKYMYILKLYLPDTLCLLQFLFHANLQSPHGEVRVSGPEGFENLLLLAMHMCTRPSLVRTYNTRNRNSKLLHNSTYNSVQLYCRLDRVKISTGSFSGEK